jgi:membrane associated rhomboid family serine protease
VNFLILLVVFAAVAYRVATPADRARYLALAAARLREIRAAAAAPRPEHDAFVAALRARDPRVLVLPAIVALNVGTAAAVLFASGSFSDQATLLTWGANLGIRTTNGDWWRLVSSAFLSAGLFPLVVNTLVLLYAGTIAERLAGRPALAAVYVAAAMLGGLQHISARPVAIGTSSSAAIGGIYGLLAACVAWQFVTRRRGTSAADVESEVPAAVVIPTIVLKRAAVLATLFLFGAIVDDTATMAAIAIGFVAGAASGLVLGYRAVERPAGVRAAATVFAAGLIAVAVYALPLRNIADVKPEIDRVIASEAKTADTFKEASERFGKQRIGADALADVVDQKIVPELRAADARLGALKHVPAEHQPYVADARDFLRLRIDGWQARADALRRTHSSLRAAATAGERDTSWRVQAERRYRSSIAAAGKAEAAERAAADAFTRVKTRTPNLEP